jgi:NAD(P)-dependent dehydrogenase (short-subunit alcohol dehydrogenase family)
VRPDPVHQLSERHPFQARSGRLRGGLRRGKAAVLAVARQTAAAGVEHDIRANTLMPWAYTHMVKDVLEGSDLGRWMEANLRLEQVSAAIAPLLHEDAPVTG